MTEETQMHPALRLFTGWADPQSRLLLVRAASGTGRTWFAKSWIGDRRGTVHDFSSREFEGLAELEAISRKLSQDPELYAAVVLSPEHTVWHLALTAKILFAQQRDLLLNAGEISAMLGGIAGSEEEALEIYGKCGGWLGAVKLLVRDLHSVEPARQTLRGALSMWLAHSDPGKELSEAAILPVFDDATVEIFYSHLHADPHTVNDLVHCGLLQENAEQDWMMPSMVRELLLERVQLAGAQRMELLEAAALEAATSVHGVLATAEAALEQRRWSVLNRLVTEKWDELLLLDLQKFMKLASRIPPAITGRNTYFGLGLRILGEFMRNDSGLQAPRLAMDYANNPLAQALRHETDRLYLNPDPQAVTIGLMEMLYLRMNGMYAEAGESALRMRSALHKASDASTGNPSLAALVHAQAGSSLFLAGRGAEAQQSYELSLDSARRTGNAFLPADPAGKLALLHALEGHADTARDYLSEHEQHISRVGWGQDMVERDAILARTCLALRMLDAELARSELSKLSRTPDMDEFWPVHAYLLAAEKFILALPATAGKLVHQMSRQRVVSDGTYC